MGKTAFSEQLASKAADVNWGQSSKKTTFESGKKEDNKKTKTEKPYGAWGPIFKNKEHFASLHNC